MIQAQGLQSETTELARVLCVAMVEPTFGRALLDNPLRAVQSHPQHRFSLTEDEQRLLIQPGAYTLQELAACIERQRRV